MAKRKSKPETVETLVPNEDYAKLSEEQTLQLLESTFETLCSKLEESGVDPDAITGALFTLFTERMANYCDREEYDAILEMALEEPWDEHTIH